MENMKPQGNQEPLATIQSDQVHQDPPSDPISARPTHLVSCESGRRSNDGPSHEDITLHEAEHSPPGDLQVSLSDEICPPTNIGRSSMEEIIPIYRGLVESENKCLDLVRAAEDQQVTPTEKQWDDLVAEHIRLQHKYHTFFLTSLHTSATQKVRELAGKHAMPDRFWKKGIHPLLNLMRPRTSAMMKHKLKFINLTYSRLFMLSKTVQTFKSIWIECLGDMGRFRIIIVDDGLNLREAWTCDSQQWFSMASDRAPETGRLYHHLGTIAYPNVLEQLFYYFKSLCVSVPFLDARKSINKSFSQPVNSLPMRPEDTNAAFLRAHYTLFSGKNRKDLELLVQSFVGHLDGHINTGNEINNDRWLVSGYQIGIVLGCAMLEYGSASNLIVRLINLKKDGDNQNDDPNTFSASPSFLAAVEFAAQTHNVVLRRSGDPNFYPYLHVTLSFLRHMSKCTMAMRYIEAKMPWRLISLMLNKLLEKRTSVDRIESEDFPRPNNETPRPLPEDFAQRGLLWVDRYYPDDWFTSKLDDDKRYFEAAMMTEEREERCLWLGCRLASSGNGLTYDKTRRQFGVPSQYDVEIPSVNAKTPMQPESGLQTPTDAC